MSNESTRISNEAAVRPVQVNYSQHAPVQVRTPDVDINIEKPDYIRGVADAVVTWGKAYADRQERQQKLDAESEDVTAKNELAREVLAVQHGHRQGSYTYSSAATKMRQITDNWLASGRLGEKDINDIVSRNSGGILKLEEKNITNWAENDDKWLSDKISKYQESNAQLRTMSPSSVKNLVLSIQGNLDTAVKFKSYMDSLPEGPEKESAKKQMEQYLGNNIYANLGLQLGNLYGNEKVATPQDLYVIREEAKMLGMRNGLSSGQTEALVNTVFDAYGVGQGMQDYSKYLSDNTKFMQAVTANQLEAAKRNIMMSTPDAALIYAATSGNNAFSQTASVQLNDRIRAMVETFKGKIELVNGRLANTAQIGTDKDSVEGYVDAMRNANVNGLVPDYTAGRVLGTGLQAFNTSNAVPSGSSKDQYRIAVQNADGVASVLNLSLVENRADRLLKSDNPEFQQLGAYLKEGVQNFKKDKAANELLLEYSDRLTKESLMANAFYYNPTTGRLAFRKPKGVIENLAFAAAGAGATTDFEAMDNINTKLKDFSPEDRVEILKKAGFRSETTVDAEQSLPTREDAPTTSGMTPYNAPLGQSGYGQLGAAMQNVNNSEKLSNGPLADPERVRRELQAAQANTATASLKSSETLAYADITQGHLPTAAEKHGVPSKLLDAIFKQESSRGTNLKSQTGVEGAMQITKDTWNNEIAPELGFTEKDFYDPRKHMEGGAYYFSKQLKAFNGDEAKALAAYNGGASVVRKAVKEYGEDWLNHIEEFSIGKTKADKNKKGKETKQYVKNILDEFYSDNDEIAPDYRQNLDRSNEEYVLKFQIDALSDAIANNKLDDTQKQLLQSYLERLSRQLRATKTGQLTWEDEPND